MKSRYSGLALLVTIVVLCNSVVFAQDMWTPYPGNPLGLHGAPGSWDQGVVTPCVIFNSDSNRYEMWFDSFDATYPNAGIGFAKSSDGITWDKHPDPVMTPSPNGWDSIAVGTPSVIKEGGLYKMWYTGHREASRTPSSIGYATSTDGGITWEKYSGNPVLSPGSGWESARVEFPSVIQVTGGYWMFYTGEISHGIARTGRAFSTDGINWQRDTLNNPVLPAGGPGQWDQNNYLGKVLQLNDTLYLCYTGESNPGVGGTAIGVATSTDTGRTWTKYVTGNPVITRGTGWDAGWIETGSLVFAQGMFRMYYDGGGPSTGWFGRVGLAFSAAEGWFAQPSGTSNDLYRMSFTDPSTGTVVGVSGTIVRTTDGGTTWMVQVSGTTQDLYSVSFWDFSNGLCIGSNGTILRTTDAGSTWIPQASGVTTALWDVFCAGLTPNIASVVGDAGTILRTTDGGSTWTQQSSGITTPLEALFFTDASNGTAVGDDGKIVHTTNGGATWTLQTSGTPNHLLEVSFSDINTGTTVGTSGTILRTTNAGTTWTSQESGTSVTLWDVSSANASTITVVGQSGTILRTTNGGSAWSGQSSGTTNTLFCVAFPDVSIGAAAGAGGTILRTINGGVVWVDPHQTGGVPQNFMLSQNYPNPFNPSTTFSYQLPAQTHVTFRIFDVLGREVATLVNKVLQPGTYSMRFDGRGLASGVYFYRLQAGDFVETKKLLLLK